MTADSTTNTSFFMSVPELFQTQATADKQQGLTRRPCKLPISPVFSNLNDT